MYIIVSWDISAGGQQWTEINQQMLDCIEGFQSIKPVNTFYIVRINSQQQRQQIADCLLSVRNSNEIVITFVVSPLSNDSNWLGFTTDESGEAVKQILTN